MKHLETLEKIIEYNNLSEKTFPEMLYCVADLVKANEKMMSDISHAVSGRFGADTNVYVGCPTCQHKTMISFGSCHVCGEPLMEVEESNQDVVVKKEDTKEEPQDVAMDELEDETEEEEVTQKTLEKDFDDEDDLDDLLKEEEPKKKEKEPQPEEDDDDFFMDDEEDKSLAEALTDDEDGNDHDDDFFDDEDLDL